MKTVLNDIMPCLQQLTEGLHTYGFGLLGLMRDNEEVFKLFVSCSNNELSWTLEKVENLLDPVFLDTLKKQSWCNVLESDFRNMFSFIFFSIFIHSFYSHHSHIV